MTIDKKPSLELVKRLTMGVCSELQNMLEKEIVYNEDLADGLWACAADLQEAQKVLSETAQEIEDTFEK